MNIGNGHIKFFFSNGILSLLIHSAGIVSAFVVNILLIRTLGVTEYGRYTYALSFLNVLLIFSVLGKDYTIKKYFPIYLQNKEWPYLKGLLIFTFRSVVILSIIIISFSLSFYFLFIKGFIEYNSIYFFTIMLIPITTIYKINISVLESLNTVISAITIKNIIFPIFFGLFILLIKLNLPGELSIQIVLLIRLLIMLIIIVVFSIWFYRKFHKYLINPHKMLTSKWLSSTLILFLIQSVQIISLNFDKIIIGTFLNSDSVSLYSVSYNIAAFVGFGLSSLNIIFAPLIVSFFEKNNMDKLESYLNLISIISLAIGSVIFTLMIFFSNNILF